MVNNDPPTTRAAIIERNQRAGTALDGAIARLSDEQLLAPGAAGEWSLKDVVAHISEPWLPAQLEAHLDGREATAVECFEQEEGPGPEFDMSTQDGRNAWTHARVRDLPPDVVRRRYADYRARMEALVDRFAESDFAVEYALAPRGHVGQVRPAREGEQGPPLWRWLAGNTWHHYEDHLQDFEAAARPS